jgi:D-alanyl-D-alanine carboxypeptidase (penicillin-binding protein 5/6)
MNIKHKAFINLGILIISTSFSSYSFAKNNKQKKNIDNTQNQQVLTEDPSILRHADTKNVFLKSKNAIIIDFETGKVLLEKEARTRIIPASMTKIMTSYLIEEKLKNGEATDDQLLPVSEKAWRIQGSKTFVPLGENVKLGDMLKGIIIQSGNDASIVAAEGLYGSEENFVDAMNEMAKKMGMTDTHFENASGWPLDNHYSTVYDLAQLGVRLIKDHPEYYSIYSEKTFTYGTDSKGNPITQGNRNPLLYKDLGCDGIKSGHTDEGGYSIVLSFVNDGRRFVAVINGLKSAKERSDEAYRILAWVRENFVNKKIYSKGEVVDDKAPLENGLSETVQVVVKEDVNLLITRSNQTFKAEKLLESLNAPINIGDVAGKIKIIYDNIELEVPVIANENIEKIGFFKKLYRKIMPS